MNTAILTRFWLARPYQGTRFIALVLLGVGFLTLAAKIQVPFYPVPMTMQTYAILVLCLGGGLSLGLTIILSYLAAGALGLPVFAATVAGLPAFVGPTGGYLVGFALAAVILGYAAQRGCDKSLPLTLAAMTLALAGIYLLGYLWLSSLVGWTQAWSLGIVPFILGDLLKISLAALSIRLLSAAAPSRGA